MKLEFFSKQGYNLNLRLRDDGVYFGALYFPRTSIDIIENETIHILEKIKTSNNEEKLCYPSSVNVSTFEATWEENDHSNIYLFDIKYQDSNPSVIKAEGLEYDIYHNPSLTYDVDGYAITDTYISQTLKINIAASSSKEGEYSRTLQVHNVVDNVSTLIAEIIFWFEAEGEDMRFKNLLENFGRKFEHSEEFIFRDSDIYEDLPDFQRLNEKRKELLIAGDSIYPYMGTYKAIINVLKFLGYEDLTIKEYWLNVNPDSENYNKYKKIDIEDTSKEPKGINLPNKQFKKTSLFGLFYPINEITGEVDEYGIPITKDSFSFTIDEVLIKLYGLKNYLKNNFLPLNARIVDITGEGIYFERYQISKWKNVNKSFDLNIGKEIDFKVSNERPIIENLDNRFPITNPKAETNLNVSNDPGTNISAYLKTPISYFDEVNDSTLKFEPAKIAGAVTTLKLSNFMATWKDLQGVTWEMLSTQKYSWETIGQSDFYELEWIVENKDRHFTYKHRGTIKNSREHEVILPYEGKYDVTLILYDTQNNRSVKVKPRVIDVIAREIEFMTFYKHLDKMNSWNELKGVKWNDIKGPWNEIYKKKTTWEDLKGLSWKDLSIFEYKTHEIPRYNNTDSSLTIVQVNSRDNYIRVSEDINNSSILKSPSINVYYRDTINEYTVTSVDTVNKYITLNTSAHDIVVGETISVSGRYNETVDVEVSNVIKINKIIYPHVNNKLYVDNIAYDVISYTVDDINETTEFIIDETLTTHNPAVSKVIGIDVEYSFLVYNISNSNIYIDDQSNFIDVFSTATGIKMYGNIHEGDYSLKIKSFNTKLNIIYVEDPNSTLKLINKKWKINWRDFDYGNSTRRSKLTYTWNDLKGMSWNDLKYQNWSNFSYHNSSFCAFNIKEVAPNGRIIIKDSVFQFSSDVITLEDAIIELNKTKVAYISDFQYQIMDTADPNFIQAVAKYPGFGALYDIYLEDGVKGDFEAIHPGETHSYPLATSNKIVKQTFNTYGGWYPADPNLLPHEYNYKKMGQRHVFKTALSGAFNWANLKASKTNIEVPTGTTIFLTPNNSKMVGRSKYIWKLYNLNNVLLYETSESYLIWNFNERGSYNIYLECEDINGNVKSTIKNEFIKVV